MPLLLFYTAHISYEGADRLDVTRKSGCDLGIHFAPSWALLKPQLKLRRAGQESAEDWEQYREAYIAEMRLSFVENHEAWSQLLARFRAVACCYCNLDRYPGHCHRLVLAELLKKCGAVYLGELPWGLYTAVPWLDLGPAEGNA